MLNHGSTYLLFLFLWELQAARDGYSPTVWRPLFQKISTCITTNHHPPTPGDNN